MSDRELQAEADRLRRKIAQYQRWSLIALGIAIGAQLVALVAMIVSFLLR